MPRVRRVTGSDELENVTLIINMDGDTGTAQIVRPGAPEAPEMLLGAADDGGAVVLGAAPPASTFQFDGYILLNIAGEPFRLDGKIGNDINIVYSQPDLRKAASLGTVENAIKRVASTIGDAVGDPDIGTTIDDTFTSLKNSTGTIPVLSSIVNALTQAELVITDVAIVITTDRNTDKTIKNGTDGKPIKRGYIAFGAALSWMGISTASKIELMGIGVDAFGFRVRKDIIPTNAPAA